MRFSKGKVLNVGLNVWPHTLLQSWARMAAKMPGRKGPGDVDQQ